MSNTPPRPGQPAHSDELVETGNPSADPLNAPAQSTVTNTRTPTASNADIVPDIPGYVIVEKIGEGGMGAVFLATDARLGRKAALKTMKPALAVEPRNRDRFFREARAAATVEHDYIVPIWQIGETADGTPFIAMPFLQGEPLDARLKRDSVVPLGLILKIAGEVAEGLAAAHAAGLIHRDIKPGNVWLEGDPALGVGQQVRRCKILDFGLARSVDADDPHGTASGVILGTPAFMAPEQARGEKVDRRADLFSLGVMLYRMATGQQPFKGDTAMSVLVALATEEPRSIRELAPNLPPEFLDLVERLMCKNPVGRPQSAAEVVAIVRELAASGPYYVPPVRNPGTSSLATAPTTSLHQFAPVSPPRPRTSRDRLTELAGFAALVPLVTAACVALWFAIEPWAPRLMLARAFLLATALAWAVVLVAQFPARDGWRRWVRYAVQFVVGAGVGVLALWCDGWDAPGARGSWDAVWVGAQYAIYFGLGVCACRWWSERLGALFAGEKGTFRLSWDVLRAPLVLIVLLVAWPRDVAPLGLAVLILGAALAAQATRPLARSDGPVDDAPNT